MTLEGGRGDGPGAHPQDQRLRVVVLFALTFAAGAVDAVSLAGLTGVFAANQTGNLILVPVGVAGFGFAADVPAALVAAGGFVLAAALGYRLMPRRAAASLGPPAVRVAALELAVVLAVMAVTWAAMPDGRPARIALGGLLAGGMGLQAALAHRMAVPGLPTVMLTGALIGLAMGPEPGARDRWGNQAAALLVMAGGALASALVLEASRPGALALGAAAVAVALVAAAAGARRAV